MLQLQLDSIAKLLDAEVAQVICIDHTGHKWRKIEIIYDDESL